MTDPTEKINYVLSLVEGATPGPWRWTECGDPTCDCAWLDNERGEQVMFLSISTDDRIPGGRDGAQIALSPLIPAALRLALAVRRWAANEDYHMGGGEQGVYDSAYLFASADLRDTLDAFLSLLPEPKKED